MNVQPDQSHRVTDKSKKNIIYVEEQNYSSTSHDEYVLKIKKWYIYSRLYTQDSTDRTRGH